MCCVSVNQKSINDGFFLNTRAFISVVCSVLLPEGRAGWAVQSLPPHPPSSASFFFMGNERSGPENWSFSELFVLNMEMVVSDISLWVPLTAVC